MPALPAQELASFVLFDLAIILVVSHVVGLLFTRIGQPRVVGQILGGVLLGPTLLGPALWPHFAAPAFLHCPIQSGMLISPTTCLFPAPAREVIDQLGQLGLLLLASSPQCSWIGLCCTTASWVSPLWDRARCCSRLRWALHWDQC
jgi:hypothetical protein